MQDRSSEEPEVRAARNQSLFRGVNDRMLELNEVFGEMTGTFAVACECADTHCVQVLELPPEAYRHVRQNPRMFVVLAEHVAPAGERVVSTHDGYVVVEAIGDGAQIADATFHAGRDSITTNE